MIPLERLDTVLHQHHLRLTRPRRVVFEFFAIADEPIQLPQVLSALGGVIDRASIYRTVTLFTQLGVVQQVHRPGRQWLELGEDFSPHHHHIVCTNCGLSQTLDSPALERTLQALANQAGFRPTSHHLEISGLCSQCLTTTSDQ